jgi:RNase P subunit RPR2
MKCIKCGRELVVGKNWREQRKRMSYYICNECNDKLTIERRKTHRDEFRRTLRKTSKIRRSELRLEIIHLLGNRCSNPNCAVIGGMTDIRALQIDHVNGGRSKERRGRAGADEMYYKHILEQIKAGSKDYQLLCANCNWIKRYEKNEVGGKKKCCIS